MKRILTILAFGALVALLLSQSFRASHYKQLHEQHALPHGLGTNDWEVIQTKLGKVYYQPK